MTTKYFIDFNLFNAAESTPIGISVPTGHTNVTLYTIETTPSGSVTRSEKGTFGVNVYGATNAASLSKESDTTIDGIVGRDIGWEPAIRQGIFVPVEVTASVYNDIVAFIDGLKAHKADQIPTIQASTITSWLR